MLLVQFHTAEIGFSAEHENLREFKSLEVDFGAQRSHDIWIRHMWKREP